mgnify:CR=1 FL=1
MALSLKRVVNNSQVNDIHSEEAQKIKPIKKRPWQSSTKSAPSSIEGLSVRKEKYLLKFFRGVEKNSTKDFLLELLH